jgi:5-methyltetrahydrofolate--homocysteine methyltransferase
MSRPDRVRRLRALLEERVLVLDGAMGTMLQQAGLLAPDFGGARYEGCHEQLVRTRPDVVRAVHHAYLGSGADIVSTNTFGGTRLVLSEYGLDGDVRTLNLAAARLAREAADHWGDARTRFVAGAIGPTTKSITVTGGVTFQELVDAFEEQALALVEGGVDLLLLETCQDTRNVKAALQAIDRVSSLAGPIPVMVSATIEPGGTMLAGQSIGAFAASLSHADLLAIGLNCATGPAAMLDPLERLNRCSPVSVSCHPNAGLPDASGSYTEDAITFASRIAPLLDRRLLNIVGGCCGTTETHIAAIASLAAGARPRPPRAQGRRRCYSGVEAVAVDDEQRPILIGERANVVGSRAFKRLIDGAQWDEAVDVARDQIRHGAKIIDVCLQSADGDECAAIPPFYSRLIRGVRAPIMVDTTDLAAMDLALTYCQGKSLVNSANLEDGGDRLAQICRVVRRHGAALVLGCIDDDPIQPQALTRERKLDVALRACQAALDAGLPPEDLIVDPLVFPCATGDPAYVGAASETVAAIALIKSALPSVATVLGISNVSFGLPAAARRVVDSVFLHHCTEAGLDLAIANPAALIPVDSIPAFERGLAENLLFNLPHADMDDGLDAVPDDWRLQSPNLRMALANHHVVAITDHFRAAAPAAAAPPPAATVDERLANAVVTGTRTGLVDDLESKRSEGVSPLAIINGPLMAGMTEVARRFKDNRMIVAEVLRSAEAMRAAVRHLEQYIDPADVPTRGTVLLATVKGDVHDIGKDLVKIILANNGYTVVDLGTRVPPEALIEACHAHDPAAIGLSGLLVKSAHQMVATAAALKAAGLHTPLLVGGAALTEQFTTTRIAPAYGGRVYYASDAMAGLAIMNGLAGAARVALTEAPAPPPAVLPPPLTPDRSARCMKVRRPVDRAGTPIPAAPYLDRRVVQPPVRSVWPFLNPFMLYNRHLGLRGDLKKRLATDDPTAHELVRVVEEVMQEAERFVAPQALWRFYQAERDNETVHLFEPGEARPVHSFHFERQRDDGGACLSDYVLESREGQRDHVVLFVATAGEGIRAQAERWGGDGEFLKAHALQALGLETAEACAEWLHQRIRGDWGFPDPPLTSTQDLFTSRYRGKRYSFGYPACPNLDDQRGIWKLLEPDTIGVRLTDGMMMDPEASVSGLVFHHPDCAYFAVEGRDDRDRRV